MTNKRNQPSAPVIAASYLGPALTPNMDAAWNEAKLPLNPDDLVQEIMGQPLRRAGRFIKLVCCGALTCIKSVPPEELQGKNIGIFLATGLGNVDEILPFITQVFKHDGGFPSPNQFANSVSNAAAFFLARVCEIKGVILTISQEELSFESALWLAQSYLTSGQIDLALVGGCDVFTPTVADYRERMDLRPDNSRALAMGEGSSWLLLGSNDKNKIGNILTVTLDNSLTMQELSSNETLLNSCEKMAVEKDFTESKKKMLLPGFRLNKIDSSIWQKSGWQVEDYLPHCGIHSTAVAYGLARTFLSTPQAFFVHFNYHASGRHTMVVAVTK
jgi:Beta-ketoacyl synthase, N-terminal domain